MKISVYDRITNKGYFATDIIFDHKEFKQGNMNMIYVYIEAADGERWDEISLGEFSKHYETNVYGYEQIAKQVSRRAAMMRPWEM